MGFFDAFFGSKVVNPALVAAIEQYKADSTDENLLAIWHLFLKSKIYLSTTADGAKSFAKIRHVRESINLPFYMLSNSHGETQLAVFTDKEAFEQSGAHSAALVVTTGENAYVCANGKGLPGLILNPGIADCEIKTWQHQVMVEKISDANKLHIMASKMIHNGHLEEGECILKAAIVAAQKDPGPQHPLTAELNLELSRMMKTQGRFNEAEWVYRRALTIYESCQGREREVANTAEELGILLANNNKSAQAVPILTHALEIYESVPGAKADSLGKILCQLGDIKIAEGQVSEGEACFKKASVLLEEKKHPNLAIVLNKMAKLCEQTDRRNEALAHYHRCITHCESLRKMNVSDYAVAACRAGALFMLDNKLDLAEEFLHKALQAYTSSAASIDSISEVETLLATLVEKREESDIRRQEAVEKAQQNRPRFGAPGKKNDLPLLDVGALKSNPKVNATSGSNPGMKAASDTPKVPEKPKNAEEEALDLMRSFLNSFDGLPAVSDNPPPIPAEPLTAQEGEAVDSIMAAMNRNSSPSIPVMPAPATGGDEAAIKSAFDRLLDNSADGAKTDAVPDNYNGGNNGSKEEVDLKSAFERMFDETPDTTKTEFPTQSSNDEESNSKPAIETIRADQANRIAMPPADSTVTAADSATISRNEDESSSASAEISPPNAPPVLPKGPPMPPPKPEALLRSEKPLAPNGQDNTVAAPSVPINTATPNTVTASESDDKKLFSNQIGGDVSSVFNKAIMGDVIKDDRFDRPIAERVRAEQPQDQTKVSDSPGAAAPSPPPPSTSSAPAPTAEPAVPQELPEAAKKALFEDGVSGAISAVFNRSILGEMAKNDRFDKPIRERSSTEDKSAPTTAQAPEPAAPKAPEPAASASNSMFSRDLDNSLNDAFSNILAEPAKSAAADRFDQQIAARTAQPDLTRFDTPISERKTEPLDADRFEKPIGERTAQPLDPDRFEKPIGERIAPPLDPDRFEKPIGERIAQPLDPDRFEKPIGERAATAASEQKNGLFDDLDDSLNDAFSNLLAKPEEIKTDRIESAANEHITDLFKSSVMPQAPPQAPLPTPPPAAPPAPVIDQASLAQNHEAELSSAKTPEELLKLLEQKLQQDPNNSELMLRKGTTLVQQQKLDEAIKVFDKVTTVDPNNMKAWYCKGSSLHLKSQFEDALYCFNHVLNLEQTNTKAMLRKAECLLKLGRFDQSMVMYDHLLLLEPHFVSGWLSKARALLQQRRIQEALHCYDYVLTIDKTNEEATKAKSLISVKLGQAAAK